MKKKVLVVTGTRAEYGLLKSIIKKILKSERLELKLLVTGMHTLSDYGLTINEILKNKINIDYVAKITPKNDMLGWLAEEIIGIRDYCNKSKPDLILILGDRDESLAAALVGAHLGISIAHIHGGDITGAVTVDDKIRDAITSLSSIHFPVGDRSALRVKQMLGPKSKNIYQVNTLGMDDIIKTKISKEKLYRKYNLLTSQPLILIVHHPSPLEKISFDNQINSVLDALKKIKANIIGILPNSDTGSEIFIKLMRSSNLFSHLFSSLKRSDYLKLLANCDVLIGNSSSGLLEAPYFATPVVNIGQRQEGRGKYQFMVSVDYNCDKISNAIRLQLKNKRGIVNKIRLDTKPSLLIIKTLEKYLFDSK